MNRDRVVRFSHLFMLATLLCVAVFRLATPLLTVLFSCFILTRLKFLNRKWIAVTIYLIIVAVVFYGFIAFTHEAITALPHIAQSSVPVIIEYAKKYSLDLPFSDLDSLKPVIVQGVKDQVRDLAGFAEIATRQFLFLLIGIVVSVSLFLNSRLDLDQGSYAIQSNLYSVMCEELRKRFSRLFQSFSTVMGAQLVISSINTALTAILLFSIGLPYAQLAVVVTFLCGMLPIVGNIISNSIIFVIAIVESMHLAVAALIFLIFIHKLEYFLNSKIIGARIKNPMWLTLLSLIVGERVMGIPGMILAPVVLNYVKLEASLVEVKS